MFTSADVYIKHLNFDYLCELHTNIDVTEDHWRIVSLGQLTDSLCLHTLLPQSVG